MPLNTKKEVKPENVDSDPRLFTWFMTLVLVSLYTISVYQKLVLFLSWQFWGLTVLLFIHILLHWSLGKILLNRALSFVYLFIQGVLGFVICWLAGNEGMVFAIFMALIGEVVGVYRLKSVTFIVASYYLVLGYVNLRIITTFGPSSWMLLGIVPVVIFVVTYVYLYMRQMEAREQAQSLAKELETANQQLSQYAAQLEDLTIANERQRMARELHDTLSQGLTGIILQLEAVEAHLYNDRVEKARTIVSNAMAQARSTLADARNAIDDLRSSQLDSLESALRLEVSRFQNASDIACDLEIQDIPVLRERIVESVVRNVAEGLTNIGRHAQSQKVTIAVSMEPDVLLVTVQDDGQGFDTDVIPSGHYGLLGIRERMRLLGGSLKIQSSKGSGTRLEMRFPL